MGYDIVAYFDANDSSLQNIIEVNGYNVDDWDDCNCIAKKYFEKHLYPSQLSIVYECKNGKNFIYAMYGTSFIRDDERLNCKHFQDEYERKFGEKFPDCLTDINYSLETPEDALQIAGCIPKVFHSEKHYSQFVEWLQETVRCGCKFYELSR